MRRLTILLALLAFSLMLSAEILTYDKVLTNLKGVNAYKKGDLEKAQSSFEENAIDNPRDGALHYNLGNAYFKNGNLEQAEQEYMMSLRDEDFEDVSQSYQNLGNIYFQNQEYDKALGSYWQSVVENPQNADARYNYELTKRYMQQQQQQQQQQNSDQNQDQQDKQEQQQQQKGEKEDEKKDQEEQQQQSDQEKKEEQQQQQAQKSKEEMKKEDAEKLLKALLEKEKEEQKKEKEKELGTPRKQGKYW